MTWRDVGYFVLIYLGSLASSGFFDGLRGRPSDPQNAEIAMVVAALCTIVRAIRKPVA